MRKVAERIRARVWLVLSSRKVWFRGAVTILLVASLALRLHYTQKALPYCFHVDESTWMSRSINILKTNDLNPHRFTKPSVMVYLNTAGLALGLVRAGTHGEKVRDPSDLGDSVYPYYESTTAIATVRAIYSTLSVISMWLAMLCIRRLTQNDLIGVLSLVFMASSPEYFRYSWWYLNVDILGVFFATCAIAYAYLKVPVTRPIPGAIVCGILAGLTLGTKYNLFWIAVPMLIAISAHREYFGERVVVFFVFMMGTFLMTTPYALFDVKTFVTHAAKEAHHYASGHHASNTHAAGVHMLAKYGKNFMRDAGALWILLGIFGLTRCFVKSPRSAALLFSYPLLLLLYMSSQRAFFARNLLVLHLTIGMSAAVGVVELYSWSVDALSRRVKQFPRSRLRPAVISAIAILVIAGIPFGEIAGSLPAEVDSRHEASAWLLSGEVKARRLVVPDEFEMDLRPLKRAYRVARFDARKSSYEELRRAHPNGVLLVPHYSTSTGRISIPKDKVLRTFGTSRWKYQDRPSISRNPSFSIVQL